MKNRLIGDIDIDDMGAAVESLRALVAIQQIENEIVATLCDYMNRRHSLELVVGDFSIRRMVGGFHVFVKDSMIKSIPAEFCAGIDEPPTSDLPSALNRRTFTLSDENGRDYWINCYQSGGVESISTNGVKFYKFNNGGKDK